MVSFLGQVFENTAKAVRFAPARRGDILAMVSLCPCGCSKVIIVETVVADLEIENRVAEEVIQIEK